MTNLSNNFKKGYTLCLLGVFLISFDSLLIKLGHRKEEDSEFAFNFDPLINNLVKLSYVKDLYGFDIKLNSSYNFDNPIPEYATDIEVSTSF